MKAPEIENKSQAEKAGPCIECPFKKDALPGWMGGHPLETYAKAITDERGINCHKDSAQICRGACGVRVNSAKLSKYNPELISFEASLREHRPEWLKEVFSYRNQFEAHHLQPLDEWFSKQRGESGQTFDLIEEVGNIIKKNQPND